MNQQLLFSGLTNRDLFLSEIRNLYCRLRLLRPQQSAKRRQLYRWIALRKIALLEDGVDPEWLRLWCRQFASLDRAAIARWAAYDQKFGADLQKCRMS